MRQREQTRDPSPSFSRVFPTGKEREGRKKKQKNYSVACFRILNVNIPVRIADGHMMSKDKKIK